MTLEGTAEEQLILDQEDNTNLLMDGNKSATLRGTQNKQTSEGHGGHGEESFGELLVHQGIETIEFILGTISNTASYLRLWALSLAHSRLSTVAAAYQVFISLLMSSDYKKVDNPYFAAPMLIVKFVNVGVATVGVLLVMDALECFLHTLRLHWVEFQSKFYKGEGLKYEAFSFRPVDK